MQFIAAAPAPVIQTGVEVLFRACLIIKELPDFSQTTGESKAKNTGTLPDSEAF
ncbi:hypothetical protein [Anaerotruncus colihominis]|uniref:Uncharacterized protein n=1 Tax=Anaerotruncus colihominis DSM 17241 TaxID=445972 RepID=B0P754_9FIRM|nr:hypothetical protein ANACOL_00582 [Anaerotruncus colihominis DSM 17241]